MTMAKRFRTLLKSGHMIVAPGAYDCVTARLVEQAGFPAVYMTGAGTAATLGYPDYGLVTMSEMADNAARLTSVLTVPLVSDIDTGYGNELNVYRTIQAFERAGVAAVHIEDQGFPKRCGHLDDKELIPREAYYTKIRAAAAARKSADFTIIARTDARAVAGLDEAGGALGTPGALVAVAGHRGVELGVVAVAVLQRQPADRCGLEALVPGDLVGAERAHDAAQVL